METWPFVSYLKGLDTSCIVTDSTSLTLTYTGGPMKTQMLQFRVTDKEKDLIEKCVNISDLNQRHLLIFPYGNVLLILLPVQKVM